MTNLTPELIEKARVAKTAEELQALAKESGWEMTAEEAAAYFAQLHPASGEMNDDELENVAGGGCHSDNRLVVTVGTQKECFVCKKCGSTRGDEKTEYDIYGYMHFCDYTSKHATIDCCNECRYCTYEKGLWLCNNPANSK